MQLTAAYSVAKLKRSAPSESWAPRKLQVKEHQPGIVDQVVISAYAVIQPEALTDAKLTSPACFGGHDRYNKTN